MASNENRILKLNTEELMLLLNMNKTKFFTVLRKGQLEQYLKNKGYELIERHKEHPNMIYSVKKVGEEIIKSDIIKTQFGWVDVSEIPKKCEMILWSKGIGKTIKFEYKEKYGEFKIIGAEKRIYDNGREKYDDIIVMYEGKEFKINQSTLRKGCFAKLVGDMTHDFRIEIGTEFKDDKRHIMITDRKYEKSKRGQDIKLYKYKCLKCIYENGWIEEHDLVKGQGCSCCCNPPKTVVVGINSIYDTDKWMIPIIGEDNAKKYTRYSNKKVEVTCPHCGTKLDKKMQINNIKEHIGWCPCNDNKSYVSKMIFSVLTQLKEHGFISRVEQEIKFDWCTYYNPYQNKQCYGIYDFVADNLIIEADGGFHRTDNNISSQSLDETLFKDCEKDRLAVKNGYDIIRISDEGDVRENILNSRLSKLFDLSFVDWIRCNEFSCNNLKKEVCKERKENNLTTTELANKFGISTTTVRKWLKYGNNVGWCEYKPNGILKHDIFIKVMDLNDKILGVYKGYNTLEKCSKQQFGEFLHYDLLWSIVEKNKTHTYNNIKIIKTTKEEYEKYINYRVQYQFKLKYIKMVYYNNTYYFENITKCAEYINYYYNKKANSSSISSCIRNNRYYYNEFNISYIWLTSSDFNYLNSYNL